MSMETNVSTSKTQRTVETHSYIGCVKAHLHLLAVHVFTALQCVVRVLTLFEPTNISTRETQCTFKNARDNVA